MTTTARPKRITKKSPSPPDAPTLYTHTQHPHQPQNANAQHQAEIAEGGFNTRLATTLTKHLGSMTAAYSFAALALVGLAAILGWLPPLVAILVAWVSQTLIQLTALSILQIGGNLDSRHQELVAEEAYAMTGKTYHDAEQMKKHMDAQDAELLAQSQMIRLLLDKMGITPQKETRP